MKRLLMIAMILTMPMMAHGAGTLFTPRIGLSSPTVGGFDYGPVLAADMLIIDSSAAVQAKYNNFTASNTFSSTTVMQATVTVNAPLVLQDGTRIVSTSTFLGGSLGSNKSFIYNNNGSAAGSSNLLNQTSSVTIPASGGLGVTYNITAGSFTGTGLTANLFVKTDSSKNFVSGAIVGTDLPGDVMYNDVFQTVVSSINFSSSVKMGALTTNQCLQTDSNGNISTSGSACGTGGGTSVYPATSTIIFASTALPIEMKFYTGDSLMLVSTTTSSTFFGQLAGGTGGVSPGTNTGFGWSVLHTFSGSPTQNVGMGVGVMSQTVSGSGNSGYGYGALTQLTSGANNTALGRQALGILTSGQSNVAIGNMAGLLNSGSSIGDVTTGSNNTFLGANSGSTLPDATQLSNAIAVGAGATVSSSFTAVIGVTNFLIQGTTPTINSCGTGSPSVAGTDTAGAITTGTGGPTSCSINFGQLYTFSPFCIAQTTFTATNAVVSAVTTSSMTITTSAGLTSGTLTYHCIGRN